MSEPVSILVVDDDPAAAAMLQEQLQDEGYVVDAVTSGKAALARAKEQAYALIVSDIEMPDLRGVDLLREILVARPQQLVLLVTAFGSIDLAVACVKNGACDFITKPFRSEVMSHAVARALRERHLRKEVVRLRGLVDSAADDGLVDGLVARSPVMQRLLSLAQRAAMSDAPVLITGESGTGKTRLARFIHEQGRRKSAAFVPVNCAALPPTLAESELFGVRKGAFTGADSDRAGLFVEADGGTIFLDEVGELPWDVQPKLLHALENGTLRAVGAQRGKGDAHVDVRVIAATNRSLEDALKTQRFRPDLYFRLNVIRIEVPPLRERRDDIPALVDTLLARAAQRSRRTFSGPQTPASTNGSAGSSSRAVPDISAEAMRWLMSREWPGNVRELTNVIERAVALAEHDTIVIDDVKDDGAVAVGGDGTSLEACARDQLPLEEIERRYVRLVVEAVDGNISKAARVLQIDRRTLYKKLGREDESGPSSPARS